MQKGDQISFLTLEKRTIKNIEGHSRAYWQCKCVCGKIINRREDDLKQRGNRIKSCGCKHPAKNIGNEHFHTWKGYGDISGQYFCDIKRKHGKYTQEFTITLEQIWKLFEKQKHLCSLTGQPLIFRKSYKDRNMQTASLDRISSKKGYVLENISWVHKDIQLMKNDLEQGHYIYMCQLVYENYINPPTIKLLEEKIEKHPLFNVDDLKKGFVIGPYTILKKEKRKLRTYWKCECECGKIYYKIEETLITTEINSCNCENPYQRLGGKDCLHWKGYGNISGQYFVHIKFSAKKRNIPFNLTIEQMWQKFEQQGGVCALTNLPLTFTTSYKKHLRVDQTASLDRIDSKKGYSIDNIWWIHKDIQRMKNHYSLEYFMHMCKLVTLWVTASKSEELPEQQPEKVVTVA